MLALTTTDLIILICMVRKKKKSSIEFRMCGNAITLLKFIYGLSKLQKV